jgi:rhodanese-related sulfurtransferase
VDGSAAAPQVLEVGPRDAHVLVSDGAFLLDVREPQEWSAGHAPEAVHVPLGELGARVGEVPKERDVVVVCRSGGRSFAAATALVEHGWRARNLAGGMQAWRDAGFDVVTDDGAAGVVA